MFTGSHLPQAGATHLSPPLRAPQEFISRLILVRPLAAAAAGKAYNCEQQVADAQKNGGHALSPFSEKYNVLLHVSSMEFVSSPLNF